MQTSNVQLGLITTLAVGLGFSLASSQAVGYPAGAAVSLGTNPIRSYAGSLDKDGSTTLFSVAEQDFIVTDVSLIAQSDDEYCLDKMAISLLSTSEPLANYAVSTGFCYGSQCDSDGQSSIQSLKTGIRVPAGESLLIESDHFSTYTYGGCSSGRTVQTRYTVSGYYTQP